MGIYEGFLYAAIGGGLLCYGIIHVRLPPRRPKDEFNELGETKAGAWIAIVLGAALVLGTIMSF